MRKQSAPRPLLPLLSCLLASLLLVPLLTAQDAGSKRDKWQRPQEVMDALEIAPGSVVADVGSGSGYFTFHLAARVGPTGKVYAVDINREVLENIRRRAEKEARERIETILGAQDDPRLPAATLAVALIVNAYHEMRRYDAMLEGLLRALKPGGRLGIIERVAAPGEERKVYFRRHRMPEELVREDAVRNGFRFLRSEPGFLRPRGKKEFYFLIFEKPAL